MKKLHRELKFPTHLIKLDFQDTVAEECTLDTWILSKKLLHSAHQVSNLIQGPVG